VKSRLTNRAQPVPPIYQPEVAADAIVWASEHERREIYVGVSTELAIIGNKIAPGLGDWYLGRTGYGSQQTSEPEVPNRPDNLWHPVDDDRDFGPHGRFDSRAQTTAWLTEHRLLASAVCIAVTAATLFVGKTFRS